MEVQGSNCVMHEQMGVLKGVYIGPNQGGQNTTDGLSPCNIIEGGEDVAQRFGAGFDVQGLDHAGILNKGGPEVEIDLYLNFGFSSG
jgi:hypothetical protein